jgi:hypothetical protein
MTNPQLSKENLKEKEKLIAGLRWLLTPRRTGRLTVGRNVTSAGNAATENCCLCVTMETRPVISQWGVYCGFMIPAHGCHVII